LRKTFRGHYQPTNEEFSNLWEYGIFVFDANVLLNLYRYSPQTSGDLIKKLQKISDRIWIPHQAALEYQNNRLKVINQQESAYKEIEDLLIKSQKTIETGLERYTRHPLIDINNIRKKINDIIVEVKEELDSSKLAHPNLINNDELSEIITTLFEGKVGSPYSSDEIDKIHKLGSKRYSRKTPPGFKDENKDDMGKYGDLVLWFQIIAYAKLTEKPIIFITDDRKEDWWRILNGKTIGPHPQLIDEIFSESNMNFYMYQPDRFSEFHSKYFNEPVNKEALNEIQEIRKQDEKNLLKLKIELNTMGMPSFKGSIEDELLIKELNELFLKSMVEDRVRLENRIAQDNLRMLVQLGHFDKIDGDDEATQNQDKSDDSSNPKNDWESKLLTN